MNQEKLRIRNFLMLTVAGIINAFGITVFLMPVNLYDSGISGTSMLLDQLTPEYLTLSIFLVVLNIPLFLFGLKKQGWRFTLYAIYAVCTYSVCAWLITDVLPIDVALHLRWQDQICCCAPYSAVSFPESAAESPSATAALWTASRSWLSFLQSAWVLPWAHLS